MLLLVDAGNTRVKWALALEAAAPGEWIAHGAVAHAELARLAPAWAAHAGQVRRALVANVAGPALAAELALLLPVAPTPFTARAELAGMRNRYREPERLGADRFAAALGARQLAPGKALVVATCGTATTVDAVSADGDFLGGMILPGLRMMQAALARGTAQLPLAEAAGTDDAVTFADNTVDAIRAGCLAAQAGAIERACARLPADLCIVSGGAGPHVAPLLSTPALLRDNIVLLGLHVAAPHAAVFARE